MTLGFDFHPEARAEFFADVDWYDEREADIGERFEVAVRAAMRPLAKQCRRSYSLCVKAGSGNLATWAAHPDRPFKQAAVDEFIASADLRLAAQASAMNAVPAVPVPIAADLAQKIATEDGTGRVLDLIEPAQAEPADDPFRAF